MRDFLRFLGTRANIRLEALTTDNFLKSRDSFLAEGRSPQTANLTIRKILKRPFTLALNEGVIQHNPVAAVRRLKGEKVEKGALLPILHPRFIHSIRIGTNETLVSDGILGNTPGSRSRCPQSQCFPPQRSQEPPGCPRFAWPRRRLFTPDQILKLLYAADREWRGMILAGYFTGARLGNLARLKWENIDLVKRSLTFVQDKTDAKIKVHQSPDSSRAPGIFPIA